MKEINPDWYPRVKSDILNEPAEDEMVVFVPDRNQVHLLNITAAAIFELCDGTLSVGDIITTLKEVSGEETEGIGEDVGKTLSEFIEKGFFGSEF